MLEYPVSCGKIWSCVWDVLSLFLKKHVWPVSNFEIGQKFFFDRFFDADRSNTFPLSWPVRQSFDRLELLFSKTQLHFIRIKSYTCSFQIVLVIHFASCFTNFGAVSNNICDSQNFCLTGQPINSLALSCHSNVILKKFLKIASLDFIKQAVYLVVTMVALHLIVDPYISLMLGAF